MRELHRAPKGAISITATVAAVSCLLPAVHVRPLMSRRLHLHFPHPLLHTIRPTPAELLCLHVLCCQHRHPKAAITAIITSQPLGS